jgi:hypothetical protein
VGTGKFGDVYAVRDTQNPDGAMYAAKVEKEDPDGLTRLREEYASLVKLGDSKYVPKGHLLEYGGG